ncbi:PfkB family carbohydrate kinase [Actinoalloteichus sp. AHMU CJ021]|uniref:PfkB family carbohydrate kinase n=1 Tax=Actinoalloteichus sp. AHMU CJ021 TaxID=2072503 RepID=UPI0026AD5CC8
MTGGPGIVVVGDALLDVDVSGPVGRICPDGPAPVLDVRAEQERPGGAALAALLAARSGATVVLATSLTDDEAGRRLRALLRDHLRLVTCPGPSTVVKTRFRSAGHPMLRADRGGEGPPPRATSDLLDAVSSAEAVLVSDYGRGVAGDPRLREVLTARARRVPVVWDPHPRGADPVEGLRLITPNATEAGVPEADATGVERRARLLRDRWRADAVVITAGERGAILDHGANSPLTVPAPRLAVPDPCGAGDAFAAEATAALAGGAAVDDAVTTAVGRAAAFLEAGGATAVGRLRAPGPPGGDVRERIASVRAAGGTVVVASGCFDLLHTGHLRTLTAARALGDLLVVCLNSDESVRRLKGPGRPVNTEHDRAEMVASLSCVDCVEVFAEDTPERLLLELRPDVVVKGADYDLTRLPEADLVRRWGGRIALVPYHPGRSTTGLAAQLGAAHREASPLPDRRHRPRTPEPG